MAVYVLLGRGIMRSLTGLSREVVFAILNLLGVYFFLFYGHRVHYADRFGLYVGLIVFQYLTLWLFSESKDWKFWLAFFTPIGAFIIVRYLPGLLSAKLGHANSGEMLELVGISYLAFRTSRLALEVRNDVVKKPGFWEYLNFSFFLPTMPVGPINTYANYRRGFEPIPWEIPIGRCALRILVGFVKFQFLGVLCNQLTYSGLLMDDHPHLSIDLPIAILFFYLYLYCNFSGFCDMAIGAAGLIGI
ncbi:MAG: hypothetical protein LV479_09545, partial [Methylacidiphilales bacterium]|nr:hypothetical protein [Candidatus Methylacidiphilales bacterium]